MKYLQSLVKIPILGPDPPSFLLPGQLIELELARQVKLARVVDEEASIGALVEPGEVEATPTSSITSQSSVFDSQFGSVGGGFDFQPVSRPVPKPVVKDERYVFVLLLRGMCVCFVVERYAFVCCSWYVVMCVSELCLH